MSAVFYTSRHGLDVEIHKVTVTRSERWVYHENVKGDVETARRAASTAGFIGSLGRFKVELDDADTRHNAHRELAIAVAIAQEVGNLPSDAVIGVAGGVNIGGRLTDAFGAIAACEALDKCCDTLLVPCGKEYALAPFLSTSKCFAVDTLNEFELDITAGPVLTLDRCGVEPQPERLYGRYSEAQVELAKRIAIGNEHALINVTGCGADIARLVSVILPPLTDEQQRECNRTYESVGLGACVVRPPYRAPHFTISTAGLLGGGSMARPGEIHLAQHGVLCLDDFAEFRNYVFAELAHGVQQGEAKLGNRVEKINTLIVAQSKACACGWTGSNRECLCSEAQRKRFEERVNNMARDVFKVRASIHVELEDLTVTLTDELIAKLRQEVAEARTRG